MAQIKHDRLLAWDPPHSSPLEHCARTMSNENFNSSVLGWSNNFKGYILYRYLVDNNLSF